MNAPLPGFADPVLDAQSCFRAVLEAMSRPGRILPACIDLRAPAPLMPAAAAVLLTLADADTPLWHEAGEDAARWIAFHCGAPVVRHRRDAAIALVSGALPDLGGFGAGTEEEPQRGATVIVQVPSLLDVRGWRLTGPGIESMHWLNVGGLPRDFLAQWTRNRGGFPCGVDLILCCGERLAALPRTVRIVEAG